MPPPPPKSNPDLQTVHRRFAPWVRKRLRARFPGDWEDLSQEVFMKIGQALPRLRDPGDRALRAFVGRTLRSVCVDEIRRRARRRSASEPAEELAADAPDAGQESAGREDLERVRNAAWQALSGRERDILALRFQEGLSFREIAEVLGVPQGSIAGWYSRAIGRLREVLT